MLTFKPHSNTALTSSKTLPVSLMTFSVAVMLGLGVQNAYAASTSTSSSTNTASVTQTAKAMSTSLVADPVTQAQLEQGALPFDPQMQRLKLPNGMSVLLYPRQSADLTVEIRLVVRAGSLQEQENERGLAHFVEHMAFNGTTDFPDQSLFKSFEAKGIQLGADVNAITSLGTTTYKLTLPKSADMKHALHAFAQWARSLTFKKANFEREREVIVEEWRLRQSVGTRINNALQNLRYLGSQSEFRDPIGLIDVVRTAPVERAKAFYDKWYRPQNMTLIVVGDFNVSSMKRMIEQQFGSMAATADKTPEDWGRITQKLNPEDLTIVVKDPEQSDRFIQIMMQHPLDEPLNTQNAQWKDTLEQLTLDILSKRFSTIVDHQKVGSVQITPASNSLSPYLTQVLIIVRPKRGQSYDDALRIAATEIKRLKDHGPTQLELREAINQRLEKITVQAQNTARMTNAQIVSRLEAGVSNLMPMLSKAQELQMNRTFALATTPAHIRASASALLDSLVKIAAVGPQTNTKQSNTALKLENQKQAKALRKTWNQAVSASTTPFDLKPRKVPELSTSAPSFIQPIKRESLTVPKGFKGEKVVFKNGATLLLMSNPDLKGSVMMTLRVKGGTSVVDDGVTRVPTALGLPMKCGLGDYKPADIVSMAKSHQLRLLSYAETLHHGLRGQSPVQNLPNLMSLLKLRIEKPQFCADALDAGRSQALEAFNYVSSERRFMDAMLQDGFTNAEQLLITPARIRAGGGIEAFELLESKLLGDPSKIVVSVVGNVPLDELYDRTAPWVATLTHCADGFDNWRDLKVMPKPDATDKVYAWSSNPKTMVQMQYISDAKWDPQSVLVSQVLGIVANLRLREALRTQLSGVYVVSLSPLLVRDPSPYFFARLNFTCAPNRADGLIEQAKKVMQDLATKGITRAELKEAQATLLHQMQVSETQTGYWAEALAQTMGDEQNIERLTKQQQWIKELSLGQVNQLIKQWIDVKPVTYQLVPRPGVKDGQ